MPLVARSYALPSTLAGVIQQIREAFSAMGDATPIMIGKAYRQQDGVGSGPRVLFVPEQRGSVGDPIKAGYACSIRHGCAVYVRAPDSGDDLTRYRATELLADRVADCIATASPGHISWNDYEPDPPLDNDSGVGAEITLTFTYRRDVRHDETRWALPAATLDTDAPIPIQPPGESPATVETTITVIAQE